MKINHTDITIVLDRSGSMLSIAADTIGGFNKFLEDQKQVIGTAIFTLNQFDNVFETPIPARNIQEVPALTNQTFVPRGNTALLDAIGRAINETGARIAALPDHEKPSKVVFVIITDGEENSSTEFTKAKINDMIKHQREKYSWEFVFLGANQDAIAVANDYGILRSHAMAYAGNSMGATAMFSSVSKNLTKTRCCVGETMAFEASDLQAQADAGLNGTTAP